MRINKVFTTLLLAFMSPLATNARDAEEGALKVLSREAFSRKLRIQQVEGE